MILGIQNRLIGQQLTYAMSYSKGFFSIESATSKNSKDIAIYLESCDCYSMQVVGDKVILGTENHEDFIANKQLFITKYQEKVNKLGNYDTTVSYEIDKRNSGNVIFYFYKTAISGSIPTGKFALSEGYYTVEIFKNDLVASSIAISIKNNIITKL
jgi:hypothetical protein